MCGIVGYIGSQAAVEIILDGLTRLEYRGYDSAGLAILEAGQIKVSRAEGKLIHLKDQLQKFPLPGSLGIGHTRWATHGKPSEANAHPHHSGKIAVVHNGIIENYLELRKKLQAQGREFKSDTDTEILAHMIDEVWSKNRDMRQVLKEVLNAVRGSYALVVLNEEDPEHLYVARHHSPLVIGLGDKENFVASDVPALLPYTRRVVFLEDGDMACVGRNSVEVYNAQAKVVKREAREITWSLSQAEKGGYKHFMLKEIFEAPRAYIDTFRSRVDGHTGEFFLEDFDKIFSQQANFDKVYLIACGTSYHAALLGKFYLEKFVGLPVIVDVASEFRYRNSPIDSKTLLIAISQSGETADTLVTVKNAKSQGAKVYSVCNVVDSSIARESDAVCYTHAGPEIGVAATKTFITQMEALLLIALTWSRQIGKLSQEEAIRLIAELSTLPQKMEEILKQKKHIDCIAAQYSQANYFLFIGRGYQFPIALEGALKLKEISYINSEGYAAGELKHGPIAMIDHGTPVIALAPQDASYEKTSSNISEVLARDANVLAIATQGDENLSDKATTTLFIPKTDPIFYPFLTAIPLQLLAYQIADLRGHDVDQPRNLAKSVTVE